MMLTKQFSQKVGNCEEVVNPAGTHVLKEQFNYFAVFLQRVWVCGGGWSAASQNEWVSAGKGKAKQIIIKFIWATEEWTPSL